MVVMRADLIIPVAVAAQAQQGLVAQVYPMVELVFNILPSVRFISAAVVVVQVTLLMAETVVLVVVVVP
jgi:hypothetical protein